MSSNLSINSGTIHSSAGSGGPAPLNPAAQELKMLNIKDLRQAELQGASLPISEEQLLRAIERSIKALQGPYTTCEVSVHDKTKTIMVKVLDRESGDLLREIPPEKTLELAAKMMEYAGILVDERR